MTRQYLWFTAVALTAMLLPDHTGAEEEKPGGAGEAADLVELEVTCPVDLREGVLRILQNEGVAAVDPASGEVLRAPSLPPVAQPISVLPPAAAALSHVRGTALDVDVIGALSDHGVVKAATRNVWLLLRPGGDPTEAERQLAADKLAIVLRADTTLKASAKDLHVELMKPPRGAAEHAKGIRIKFEQRVPSLNASRPAPSKPVPLVIPVKRISEHLRAAGKLTCRFQRKEATEYDAASRHRTVIRQARVICDSHDPWHMWESLREAEVKEQITVIEVRYSRGGYHLARPMSAEDVGSARVKFAVRHPWIPSEELRRQMGQTGADRDADAAPRKQRLQLRCSRDQVEPLLRLLSADGIAVRTKEDGRLLHASSPATIELAPSAAELLGAFADTFADSAFKITSIDGGLAYLGITGLCDLPRIGLDANDPVAVQAAVEERLREGWKGVEQHPVLSKRVYDAQIHPAEAVDADDPKTLRVTVFIDMLLHSEPARKAPAGSPLRADALAKLRALMKNEGWLLRRGGIPLGRDERFREGLLQVRVGVQLDLQDGLDAAEARRALSTIERLPGTCIEGFGWTEGEATLTLTLLMQYPLWPAR